MSWTKWHGQNCRGQNALVNFVDKLQWTNSGWRMSIQCFLFLHPCFQVDTNNTKLNRSNEDGQTVPASTTAVVQCSPTCIIVYSSTFIKNKWSTACDKLQYNWRWQLPLQSTLKTPSLASILRSEPHVGCNHTSWPAAPVHDDDVTSDSDDYL